MKDKGTNSVSAVNMADAYCTLDNHTIFPSFTDSKYSLLHLFVTVSRTQSALVQAFYEVFPDPIGKSRRRFVLTSDIQEDRTKCFPTDRFRLFLKFSEHGHSSGTIRHNLGR